MLFFKVFFPFVLIFILTFFLFHVGTLLLFVQHSLIHSHNCFRVYGGSVLFLFLGIDIQLNNCFWKIQVALRRDSWCDLCRLICSSGLSLLAGLAGRP